LLLQQKLFLIIARRLRQAGIKPQLLQFWRRRKTGARFSQGSRKVKQTDRQTDRQTNKTNNEARKQASKQGSTRTQINKQTNKQTNYQGAPRRG
jgi:hypothetical protein